MATDPQCDDLYRQAGDFGTESDTDIDFEHHVPTDSSSTCWEKGWEHHQDYDLLFAEFDDQGWENRGADPSSRVPALISRLNKLMAAGPDGKPQPLNVVVFVHGWHHSAEATDNNVKQFRFILGRTALIEGDLAELRKPKSPEPPGPFFDWQKKRRVVGIYVGWRGDSVKPILGLDNTSIWDRKLAAENVASGSVSVLFAALQNFYNENSCREKARTLSKGNASSPPPLSNEMSSTGTNPDQKAALKSTAGTCTDARMLVLGHSFGGLIVYRSLSAKLVANSIETFSPWLKPDESPPAVGFGDLVMLINPAFEATRFEPLAQAAASRTYASPTGARPQLGQLPVVIVVQSRGDTATGDFFPIFRNVSTVFDDTPSAGEPYANTHTVGWDPRYQTHELELDAKHAFPCPNVNLLACENDWFVKERTVGFADFGGSLPLPDNLYIHPIIPANEEIHRPPFDPVWVVTSSKAVIGNHDDLLNIQFIRFVRQMYYGVLHEEDCELLEAVGKSNENSECPSPAFASHS